MKFLGIARSVVLNWDRTKSGTVIKYLCRHATVPIETRKVNWDSNGNLISVNVKHRLTGAEKRISLKNLSERRY